MTEYSKEEKDSNGHPISGYIRLPVLCPMLSTVLLLHYLFWQHWYGIGKENTIDYMAR